MTTTRRPAGYQVRFHLVSGESSVVVGRFTEAEAVARVAELRQRDDVFQALFVRAAR